MPKPKKVPSRVKVDTAKEARRAARTVLGESLRGRKPGAFTDEKKQADKDYCREEIEEEEFDDETPS